MLGYDNPSFSSLLEGRGTVIPSSMVLVLALATAGEPHNSFFFQQLFFKNHSCIRHLLSGEYANEYVREKKNSRKNSLSVSLFMFQHPVHDMIPLRSTYWFFLTLCGAMKPYGRYWLQPPAVQHQTNRLLLYRGAAMQHAPRNRQRTCVACLD